MHCLVRLFILCVIYYITTSHSLDDHNRVKLTKSPGEVGSDYINASFIDVSSHNDYTFKT